MAKINQTITQFPTAPDSATDSAPIFNTKANAFVGHQSGVYVGEVNTWATEANALRDDVNNIVATIPSGTIDDTNLGNDKVFSNQHLVDTNYGIESGAGWTKFPDGTMICTGKDTTPTSGNLLVGFAKAFVSSPTISALLENNSALGGSVAIRSVTTTQWDIRTRTDVGQVLSTLVHWQAIGRWK